ncbi:hypothetical protein DH2020_029408 [Rehmannia glutinosa]|uniref:LRRK2 ARM repeat domain-containing protein n=1 Tax=Rehmannia glutinosa TaxID=99300 RepID=A0ABR0VNN1_REHGL
MGPAKAAARTISQQAFDEMVQENIDDLEMDPTEALEDAIQTLTLQGVDLSGIVTCVPGESNPVMDCLGKLKEKKTLPEIVELNAPIATKNGAVELVISICSKLREERDRGLASALNALASVIHDLQSSEIFKENGGPRLFCDWQRVLKESFMDLKIDELIVQILKEHNGGSIPSIYDAIRVILSSDDNRVIASQVFGYARKFAKLGIAEVLVESLREGLNTPDEICRSVANSGGIDVVLRCLDDSGVQGNDAVARACCSLLSKVKSRTSIYMTCSLVTAQSLLHANLTGSDANKSTIVEKRGMDRLINLSARFSDDPSVLQEVMSIICTLCLRSPENAARAIESGAGDLAIQAMQNFPESDQLQRNSCFMIRNLVARNPENRKILLSNGIEEVIRKAKQRHKSCKDAATDALRDLGVDNYNS